MFYSVIQMGFDTCLSKVKSNEMRCSSFPPMQILFTAKAILTDEKIIMQKILNLHVFVYVVPFASVL